MRPERLTPLPVVAIVAVALVAAELGSGSASPGAALPDLVQTGVSVSQRIVSRGASVRVMDAVRNRGGATAPRSATGYYLSRDRAQDASDVRLGRRLVGSLRPRATSRGPAIVRIPASATPGRYRMLACADDRRRVRESDEVNNCRAATASVEVTARPGDRTPPTFAGLRAATTCIPGPIDGGTTARYRLSWQPATDNVTPSGAIVYDVYQATAPGGENFSAATYTAPAGSTTFTTPALPADTPHYFVVRARDCAGNRDSNKLERAGENLCV